MAGIRYKGQIFSGVASVGDADEVSYDNTQSGLTATNVQDALDEVNAKVIIPNSTYCLVTSAASVTSDSQGWVYVSYKGTQLTTANCSGLWVAPNTNSDSEYTCFERVMWNSSGDWRVRCIDYNGNVLKNSTKYIRFFAYVSKSIL